MPQLAFDIAFFAELPKLQPPVRKGVLDAWEKFSRLTLDQLFKDPGLKLESLTNAKDKQIRTIRIDQFWRGVVLAPPTGDTFVLLTDQGNFPMAANFAKAGFPVISERINFHPAGQAA